MAYRESVNLVEINKVVGASLTNVSVSKGFRVNPDMAKNFCAVISLSNVTLTTGITFSVFHSFDDGATYTPVGSESNAAVSAAKTAASATDINAGTDTITITSHGYYTGQKVIFKAGTAAPAGLTGDRAYYVISTGANTFQLADTYEDALAATEIDITSTGTGTQSFFVADLKIKMDVENTDDLAQLPIFPSAKIVVTTGAGDSVACDGVWITGMLN